MNDVRITKKQIIWSVVFVILLFNRIDVANSIINTICSYFDEIIEVACLIYLAIYSSSKYFRVNGKIVIIWTLFLFIGLLGSLLWREQSIIAVSQDLLITCSKFIIGYLAAYIYFSKRKNNHENSVFCLARMITIILVIISVHDLLLPEWFPQADFRYFMYSQRLLFEHVTYLTHAAVTLLIIFTYANFNSKNNYYVYMLMASYLVIVGLRTKGIGFLLAFWFVYVFLFVLKIKKRGFIYFGAALVVALCGLEVFESYFLNTSRYSPRRILLLDSLKIMVDKFPIGSGFASFGSPLAARYYSPIYVQLDYGNYWGMGQGDNMFLSDNFWPCIFAQFGFIGTVLFCILIGILLKKVMRILRYDKESGFILLMILAYMLISSLAETSFFNPTSFLLFLIFAFVEVNSQKTMYTMSKN